MRVSKRGPVTAASAVVVYLVACSPGAGTTGEDDPNLGFSGSTGTSGSTGMGGSGNVPNSGTGGDIFIPPTSTGGSTGGPDGSCSFSTAKAERVVVTKEVPTTVTVTEKSPVALYFMQDQSGSMIFPILPPTRWQIVQQAVQAFTNDPQSAGLDIALQFFALGTSACDGSGGYDVPEVPLGPLPQNAAAINNAYAAHVPFTGTPIEPGLRGAVNYCLRFESTNSIEDCVAVLITDGAPSDCLQDANGLAAIAGDAFSKGVMTYAIGMEGADFNTMDLIARAGGTDCTPATPGPGGEACNVSGGGSSFIDALNTIRKTVSHDVTTTKTVTEIHTSELACDFKIPPPPTGQTLDPNKVNVHFTHSGLNDTILQVPSEADCAKASGLGWYYDNPTTPTTIKVCDGTCASIKASTGDAGTVIVGEPPQVQILLGCETEKSPIH